MKRNYLRLAAALFLCVSLLCALLGCAKAEDPAPTIDLSGTWYADIVIADYGTVTVQLACAFAPITCTNFITLAQKGFYDGLTFHRVVKDFVVQGGDPDGSGYGGSGTTIFGEFALNGHNNPISHTRGVISMARGSEYNSASSQFFIVHQDSTEDLDGKYAAFGYVIQGMDVIDALCETVTPANADGYLPFEEQPIITSVTAYRKDI